MLHRDRRPVGQRAGNAVGTFPPRRKAGATAAVGLGRGRGLLARVDSRRQRVSSARRSGSGSIAFMSSCCLFADVLFGRRRPGFTLVFFVLFF